MANNNIQGHEDPSWASWVIGIDEKANTPDLISAEEKLWNQPCIYRVPTFARELNTKAFTPQVVSLGPFHHDQDHLKPMEEHKERALVHFLKRAGRPLADYEKAVQDHLQELQGSYSGLESKWRDPRDKSFLKLMILDGCFMLEVLRTNDHDTKDYYAHNDPIFSKHGVLHLLPYIRRDVLILENQLPLLLIKILLQVQTSNHNLGNEKVNNPMLKFCAQAEAHNLGEEHGLGLHALDLFRRNMLGGGGICSTRGGSNIINPRIPMRPAAELHEAGVRFKKIKSKGVSLGDIKFERGVLYLPAIEVDDAFECNFLNLVAFEHLHVDTGNDVTSYLSFMDEIVDTAEDVKLLRRRGIIDNGLGSDEAVARLFNTLSKETTLDPQCGLGVVLHNINEFCHGKWNEWWANLNSTYFKNPWSSISLAAAIFLLLLTVCQTVYTVLQYKTQNSGGSAPPPAPHK